MYMNDAQKLLNYHTDKISEAIRTAVKEINEAGLVVEEVKVETMTRHMSCDDTIVIGPVRIKAYLSSAKEVAITEGNHNAR